MENSMNQSILTVKNVVRLLAIICLIVFFCPTFLVSCSGKDLEIGAMTAVGGISVYGERVSNPQPLMLICLIIPVAIIVLASITNYLEKTRAMMITIAGIFDLLIWMGFKAVVKSNADQNYCEFDTTGWYILNNITLILIIIISLLVMIQKIRMDSEILPMLTGNKAQGALKQMSASMNQMSNAVSHIADNLASNAGTNADNRNTIGYCPKCGNPIKSGALFCSACGTSVPESLIKEAEASQNASEDPSAKTPDPNGAEGNADNNN